MDAGEDVRLQIALINHVEIFNMIVVRVADNHIVNRVYAVLVRDVFGRREVLLRSTI